MTDHRTRPRRRGAALESAILDATHALLAEVGYAALTMDQVAERAGTGKASLYRRWPDKRHLTLDAVRHATPEVTDPADTGDLRGDLLAWLRSAADVLAGPAGEALRALLSEALREPAGLTDLRERSGRRGRAAMTEIAGRALTRGEIPPESLHPLQLDVAQAMLREQFLFRGAPVPDTVLTSIVDDVVLPLLTR